MWYFFFNDTATTEIYTLSLHDALPIFELDDRRATAADELQVHVRRARVGGEHLLEALDDRWRAARRRQRHHDRSEEHTSELQSRQYLVCRLLLEKKNNQSITFFRSLSF